MKVKVSELQGAALDWAVAKCKGMVPNTPFIAANKEYTYINHQPTGHKVGRLLSGRSCALRPVEG
jgi:hypothetical protein